jgi:hypothetical protein
LADRKRLTLFVEGDGDHEAVPVLIRHFLTLHNAWDWLELDPQPVKVGNVAALLRARKPDWRRRLLSTVRSHHPAGVMVLLDGDGNLPRKEPFCAGKLGRELCQIARDEGGGTMFSLAAVFAMKEYESWLIGGVESLRGQPLADGRPGIRIDAEAPPGNLEDSPRDAKQWLKNNSDCGYKPTTEQEPLTQLLVKRPFPDRLTDMPSFQRLERALIRLLAGMKTGNHILSPDAL